MTFNKLTSGDYEIIAPYMNGSYGRLCDYTPSATLMWAEYYNTEYSCDGQTLIHRAVSPYNGEHFYCLPLGDVERGIRLVLEEEGGEASFGIIPDEYVNMFSIPGCSIETSADRNHFDYLYKASDLIGLRGKKYAGQRNHIHKFDNAVSSWELRDITADNLGEVIDFYNTGFKRDEDPSDSAIAENGITLAALCDTAKYRLTGSALYANGKVVGFALGEVIGDTLYVHSEKADRSFPGAYQKLVNTFTARHAVEGVEFVNREDDLGDIGLRTAKLAYHPYTLLAKNDIKIKKEP